MKSLEDLHQKAKDVAARYRKSELELLDILQELDHSKLYYHYKCSSLLEYAMKEMGLSEDVALNFIRVARIAVKVPEIKAELRAETMTVSKARKIASVITPKNQSHWIDLAKTLPKAKLEKEIAKANPKEATPERAKYVSETRLELKMGIQEDVMNNLKWAQDYISQKLKRAATYEETLSEVLKYFRARKDLTKRVETPVPGPAITSPKKLALIRDNGQRTHRTNGERCDNQRWLDIHHIIPRHKGGKDTLNNLTTLCSAHHRMLHY